MTKYEQYLSMTDEELQNEDNQISLEQAKAEITSGISECEIQHLKAKRDLSDVRKKMKGIEKNLHEARSANPISSQVLINGFVEKIKLQEEIAKATDKVDYYAKIHDFMKKEYEFLFSEVKEMGETV